MNDVANGPLTDYFKDGTVRARATLRGGKWWGRKVAYGVDGKLDTVSCYGGKGKQLWSVIVRHFDGPKAQAVLKRRCKGPSPPG